MRPLVDPPKDIPRFGVSLLPTELDPSRVLGLDLGRGLCGLRRGL